MQNPVPDAPPGQPVRSPEGADAVHARAPDATGATPATAGTSLPPGVGGATPDPKPIEIDGPSGPEPTRYGDWERKGRCIDF